MSSPDIEMTKIFLWAFKVSLPGKEQATNKAMGAGPTGRRRKEQPPGVGGKITLIPSGNLRGRKTLLSVAAL